ncbi:MAG: hypothetical protein COA97_06185 [Flavobacteriales bacterium]|nr:MAG: hypothetical protein COA97_06185 [Flavobacteriales bacterium]
MKQLLIISIILSLFTVDAFSQVNFTGYLVDGNDKKMKDVTVNLYKGNEIVSTKKWGKKFDYNLALETYYTLELIKEGFISKRIAISTFEGDKGAEPFMFVMELIKVQDGIKGMDEDYPSALIEYKKDEGTFNFDVNYAKNLKKEQKEAAKKKKSGKN